MNWLQFGLGAAAAFALSFLLHTVDVNRLEKIHTKELTDQAARLEGACKDDQKLTKGINDDLQNQLGIIAGKLAAAKRMRPATCVVPIAGKADMEGKLDEYAGRNGISSNWLREYGAECEEIRQGKLYCEKFVDDVWASRAQ